MHTTPTPHAELHTFQSNQEIDRGQRMRKEEGTHLGLDGDAAAHDVLERAQIALQQLLTEDPQATR